MHSTGQETAQRDPLEGTDRIALFSDAVIAIVITLLILEIHVPELHELTSQAAWHALQELAPKLISFVLSFVTVTIFWVNHHHFFHAIQKSDSALLWYNNHLLFWIAVIPFATAFMGDYPTIPLVVALYGLVLCIGAAAFSLMIWHVFFRSNLIAQTATLAARQSEFQRSLLAVLCYAIAIPAAFIHVYIAFAIFILIPLYYFVPRRIREGAIEQAS